jgi:hypothetical protein
MRNIIYLALLLISFSLSAQDAKDVYNHPDVGNKNVNGKVLTNIQFEFSATRAYNYKQGSKTEKIYWFTGSINVKYTCNSYAYNGVIYNLNEVDKVVRPNHGTLFYNNEALNVSVNFSQYFDSYNGKLAPASGKSLRSKDFQEAVSYDNLKFSGVSISNILQSNEMEENIKKYINRNKPKEEVTEKGRGNNSDSESNNSNLTNNDEKDYETKSNSNSSSSNNSNSNSSSNSNNDNTYENRMNETQANIERVDKNFDDLSEQLTSSFDNIRSSMAKEKDFQDKVSSLTSIQATDASGIISEARQKSRELDVAFNQKSTDAYNEINKIGTDLAGSAENNEQLILSGGLTIGMHILSQNSVEKARQEAKRQLDAQKEIELQKIAGELISRFQPIKEASYERIPYAVLEEEEIYFNEQFLY